MKDKLLSLFIYTTIAEAVQLATGVRLSILEFICAGAFFTILFYFVLKELEEKGCW